MYVWTFCVWEEVNGDPPPKTFSPDALSIPPWPVQMREGMLPNGLRYIILNNQSPPERFEAHLEVSTGAFLSYDASRDERRKG